MIGEWIKGGLTVIGRHSPRDTARLLNGATNFVDTGIQLRERGLTVPPRVASRFRLFDMAMPHMQSGSPIYLEFGVYQGETIRYWAEHLSNPKARLFGFDSFEGLPDDWTAAAGRGHFSIGGEPPRVDDDRVEFVKGWFNDSLPSFDLPSHDRLFINVDSDLYSSAATVLGWVAPHFDVGDFLYFDEFHDRLNEGRAFCECFDHNGYGLEIVGATRSLEQVLFRRTT
jgi:hypothetical protein